MNERLLTQQKNNELRTTAIKWKKKKWLDVRYCILKMLANTSVQTKNMAAIMDQDGKLLMDINDMKKR